MPWQDGTIHGGDTGIGTGEAVERRSDDPVHDRQEPAGGRRLPAGGEGIAPGYQDTAGEVVPLLSVSQAVC